MHFLVHVILPPECREPVSAAQVNRAVEKLLTPYYGGDGGSDDGWFDWYELGGRFAGAIKPPRPLVAPPRKGLVALLFRPQPPAHTAYASDVLQLWSDEAAPFVLVTPDGVAHGQDDWAKEPYAPWAVRFKELLAQYSTHLVVAVDAHN
jgi:hypothetical protein